MQRRVSQGVMLIAVLALLACDRRTPLTEEKARQLVFSRAFKREPVYAEVPQRVWWNPGAPKDDFDEKSVASLRNLQRVGLVTVSETVSPDGSSAEYIARVTDKGFPILGTAPSYRGPVYRGKICEKVYDGLRDFQRHPSEPTVGHAKLIWHYENPTALYPLFETKRNKPLHTPFASHLSFYWKDYQWRMDVTVNKAEVE